jgi:oxygen-independent coproporphyrinogen-3 oxidase
MTNNSQGGSEQSGIYIHIPFCSQACRYCDFYFTVSQQYRDDFVEALLAEIRLRKSPLTPGIGTVYFGGGTPSRLSIPMIEGILSALHGAFSLAPHVELTLEANPDDLTPAYLRALRSMGVNRLSVGIQSFHQQDLDLMKRSHDAQQALRVIPDARDAGFSNINMDLIYGVPGQGPGQWEFNLEQTRKLDPTHLSAYHLSFEEGTVFDHWRKKGRIQPLPDESSVRMYRMLRSWSKATGFEHYEISNLAREGQRSRHNLLYWTGHPYVGLGPSAHSLDGEKRSWNAASLKTYLAALGRGQVPLESEVLSPRDRYHDYVITSLRCTEGADPEYIGQRMGPQFAGHFLMEAKRMEEEGYLLQEGGRWTVLPDQWIMADHIMRELFMP